MSVRRGLNLKHDCKQAKVAQPEVLFGNFIIPSAVAMPNKRSGCRHVFAVVVAAYCREVKHKSAAGQGCLA
jgi:hypothetical protein